MNHSAENPPYTVDVTTDTLVSDVMEPSKQTLVLMQFWAAWCGPCKALMPILGKLAAEYKGGFRLARVNIDEQQALASQFNVRSVPTVKLIKDGKIVDEFMGALPEGEVRKILDRHVVKESDKLLDVALYQYESGQKDEALAAIEKIAAMDPGNTRIGIARADLLIREQQFDAAEQTLKALPMSEQMSKPVAALFAKIEVSREASGLPSEAELLHAIDADPDNSRARFQLGTLYSARGDYEPALDQLLQLVQRDRKYNDDAGRKAMVRIFDLLGDTELVKRYRQKMMAAMY